MNVDCEGEQSTRRKPTKHGEKQTPHTPTLEVQGHCAIHYGSVPPKATLRMYLMFTPLT